MSPIKRFMPFIFAGVLGLAAVLLLQHYLQQQRRALDAERQELLAQFQDQIEVIVAKADLPADKTLELADLGRRGIPSKFIPPYATSDPREVVGMVTIAPFAEGEPVLRNKLRRTTEISAATLAALTPEGKRAVTIALNPVTGVGGFVRPGDKVDLLWTFRLAGAGGAGAKSSEEPVTLTLFQDVPVLAVNNQILGKPPPTASGTTSEPREYTVTLALSPNEAALVLFAREQGLLQLSLRSQRDAGRQEAIQPATMDALMQAVLGPPEAPEGPPPRTVEVYRGLQRDVVTVEAQ